MSDEQNDTIEMPKSNKEQVKTTTTAAPKKQLNLWAIFSVALFILYAFTIYTDNFAQWKGNDLGPEKVQQLTVDYVNTYLLPEGMSAATDSVVKTNGVYQVSLIIDGNKYISYSSLNGAITFPSGYDMSQPPHDTTQQSNEEVQEEGVVPVDNLIETNVSDDAVTGEVSAELVVE